MRLYFWCPRCRREFSAQSRDCGELSPASVRKANRFVPWTNCGSKGCEKVSPYYRGDGLDGRNNRKYPQPPTPASAEKDASE